MSSDFIDDLLGTLDRIFMIDHVPLREILIVCGMPERTQNLRYLNFNHQVGVQEGRNLEYSAVAVINNRRAGKWRLDGYRKKISQLVFRPMWTRNPLDLFLSNLRCNPQMMALLEASQANYTLMGILQVGEVHGTGHLRGRLHRIRPVVGIPGISKDSLKKVIAFENVNEIRKS
jgi:hypothetical protein